MHQPKIVNGYKSQLACYVCSLAEMTLLTPSYYQGSHWSGKTWKIGKRGVFGKSQWKPGKVRENWKKKPLQKTGKSQGKKIDQCPL